MTHLPLSQQLLPRNFFFFFFFFVLFLFLLLLNANTLLPSCSAHKHIKGTSNYWIIGSATGMRWGLHGFHRLTFNITLAPSALLHPRDGQHNRTDRPRSLSSPPSPTQHSDVPMPWTDFKLPHHYCDCQ